MGEEAGESGTSQQIVRMAIGKHLRLLLAGGAMALLTAAPARSADMRRYETPYYVIHTDLDEMDVREAVIRMNRMVVEYLNRCRGFSGQITTKLPFYLYRDRKDYEANDGLPGTAGVYVRRRLMAVVGERLTERSWHVIQHEAFHQFADKVIRGRLPIWINEGLAEYFGNAIFTGDGFVVGNVPPQAIERIKEGIEGRATVPFETMMLMTSNQWIKQLDSANYDQAWSMIHFLAHADGGRYQRPFSGMVLDIGAGMDFRKAWPKWYGTNVVAAEKRWREWWLSLPDDPTPDVRQAAAAMAMGSFIARAAMAGQHFKTADEFFATAEGGNLKCDPANWLPPSLLDAALPQAKQMGTWSILPPPGSSAPKLRCELPDGGSIVVQPQLVGRRIAKVAFTRTPAPARPKPGPTTQPRR